jgi:isopentenyl diphosphate isomerase/L-lactate dehydrogenase-like FMN-dependent dehydrogenase
MAGPKNIHAVADFRDAARRRLPRFAFDFVDGGAGRESARWRNEQAFRDICLTPRIGIDTSAVSLETTLFGQNFAAPFGVAPLGLCGIVHPEADLQIARIAARYRLPYIASTTASAAVEDVAQACGVAPWFQLYASKAQHLTERLIDRVERLGCPVLVVTVDTAAPGRRVRDLRNGLQLPFRPTLAHAYQALKHPLWTTRRLAAGSVSFPNIDSGCDEAKSLKFSELMALQTGGVLDWAALGRLRQRWPRTMLLKGVLSAADASRARALGVDGVIVSSHGGRQLDCAPAPIDILPEFAAAGLPPDFLLLDSGVRSGEDILKVIARGGSFAFLGRPFLFALAAAGERGVERVVEILMEELACAMRMMGARGSADLRAGGTPDVSPPLYQAAS